MATNIRNIAREFLGDTTKITLPATGEFKDEWEFDLILEEGDKLNVLDTIARVEQNPSDVKSILKEQHTALKEILRRSYPEDVLSNKQIETLVMKRGTEIVLELTFVFGIRDRDEYKKLIEQEKSKKNNPESDQPRKEAQ